MRDSNNTHNMLLISTYLRSSMRFPAVRITMYFDFHFLFHFHYFFNYVLIDLKHKSTRTRWHLRILMSEGADVKCRIAFLLCMSGDAIHRTAHYTLTFAHNIGAYICVCVSNRTSCVVCLLLLSIFGTRLRIA